MDEKQAWASFAHTGKIEDYIRYAQIRNQAGAFGAACMPEEVQGAGKDLWADHPGTGGGGE